MMYLSKEIILGQFLNYFCRAGDGLVQVHLYLQDLGLVTTYGRKLQNSIEV